MKLFKAIAVAVLAAGSFEASAYPGFECQTGSGAQGYNSGYQAQYGVIDHLWTQVHQQDCFSLESFIEAVDVPYFGTLSSSAFLRCRDQGLIDGISGRVNDIITQCVDESTVNGEEVGIFNGRLYCGVPAQQGYSARASALPLASIVASQSCKVALKSYVSQNCPNKPHADPGYNQFVLTACGF